MSDDRQIIQNVNRDDFELELALENQATECRISVKPKKGPVKFDPKLIHKLLAARGICSGVDDEKIQDVCQQLGHGHHIHNEIIAHSNLPTVDTDGHVEFTVKTSTKKPRYETDQSGSIDFKSANLFENVEKDQVIGIVHDPKRAKNGSTVLGQVLPCQYNAVPPKGAQVRLGEGAKYKDNHTIIASKAGRVIFENDLIAVSDEFLVSEDVDFDIGHIDFVGFVQVNGDVVDGFNVRGRKGVRIRHNVGHCTIESDGDIELSGMTGEGGEGPPKSRIRCGGNLRVRHVRNVDIECEGNIEIQKEALHCNIRCGGQVSCRGTIAGGQCVAFNGIEVGVAGTELNVETSFCSGKDFHLLELRQRLKKRLAINEKQQAAIDKFIGPYMRMHNPAGMKEQYKSKLSKALRRSTKLKQVHEDLKIRLQQLNEQEESIKANAKVNVQKHLHKGTVINLGRTTKRFDQDLKGPITLIEHRQEDIIPIRLTPLNVNAKLAENDLVQKEIRELLDKQEEDDAEAAKEEAAEEEKKKVKTKGNGKSMGTGKKDESTDGESNQPANGPDGKRQPEPAGKQGS